MANWCSTTFRFRGQETELETLHKKIKEWTASSKMETDFGDNWLGNIVIGSGYKKYVDNEDPSKNIECRGRITDLKPVACDNTGHYLELCTETAWVPMARMWDLVIISLNLQTVRFTFEAEECGCELYWIYDPRNYKDFTDEIRIDAYGDEQTERIMGYYTVSEAIDILNDFFGTSFNDIHRFHPLCEQYEKTHDNTNISIHQFRRIHGLQY